MEFLSKFKKVPVIIEKYKKHHGPGSQNSLKFLVSCNMTVSQLVYIVRHRMNISLDHGFHLLFNKGRTSVKMSQQLGEIPSNYKDPKGILRFIFVAQSTFGCHVPRIKPVRSKFPGSEPNPFGAPEPSSWFDGMVWGEEGSEESIMLASEDMEEFTFMEYIPNHASPLNNVQQTTPNPAFLNAYSATLGADDLTDTEPTAILDDISAISSISVPLDVLEPSIFFEPLCTLHQSLEQYQPHTLLQIMSFQQMPSVLLGIDLLNSLNRLAEAVLNHIPYTLYELNQTSVTLAAPQLPPTDPSSFVFSPFSQEMLGLSTISAAYSPVGQKTLPVSPAAILHTLNLANQAVVAAIHQVNTSSFDAAQAAQFGLLTGYVDKVIDHLEYQTSTSMEVEHLNLVQAPSVSSNANGNQHNSSANVVSSNPSLDDFVLPLPAFVLPFPGSFLNSALSLHDIDSDSSDDDITEHFCNTLL